MPFSKKSKDNLKLYSVLFALLALFALVNFLILGKIQLCIWRAATGLPCPGCGLTHAGFFLLKLDFRNSLVWNPFLVPLVITYVLTSLPYGVHSLIDRFKNNGLWIKILFVSMTAFYFFRLFFLFPQPPPEGPMYFDEANYTTVTYKYLKKITGIDVPKDN